MNRNSYPSPTEIDRWAQELWAQGQSLRFEAGQMIENGFRPRLGARYLAGAHYIEFEHNGRKFYGYWQPCLKGPAPLLIHTPGYGAEITLHPDLVLAGFNVLHVNPLGYMTPNGADESKRRDGDWPVLPDTVLSESGKGYREWLLDCLVALRWALRQKSVLPDRIAFFGTSQGGGASLLLASILRDYGARCVAAEVPFLTDFRLAAKLATSEIYNRIAKTLAEQPQPERSWRLLGFFDTISHAHRLEMPVLLTLGGQDRTCPPETIASLHEKLAGTRLLYSIHDRGHSYTPEFQALALAWFRLYA